MDLYAITWARESFANVQLFTVREESMGEAVESWEEKYGYWVEDAYIISVREVGE